MLRRHASRFGRRGRVPGGSPRADRARAIRHPPRAGSDTGPPACIRRSAPPAAWCARGWNQRQGQRAGARGERPARGRDPDRDDSQATSRELPGTDGDRRPADRPGDVHPPRRRGPDGGSPDRAAARPTDRVRAADRDALSLVRRGGRGSRAGRGRPRWAPRRDARVGRRRGGHHERRPRPHGLAGRHRAGDRQGEGRDHLARRSGRHRCDRGSAGGDPGAGAPRWGAARRGAEPAAPRLGPRRHRRRPPAARSDANLAPWPPPGRQRGGRRRGARCPRGRGHRDGRPR